jgi:hypothetical protein
VGDGGLTASWLQESDFIDIGGELALERITRSVEAAE